MMRGLATYVPTTLATDTIGGGIVGAIVGGWGVDMGGMGIGIGGADVPTGVTGTDIVPFPIGVPAPIFNVLGFSAPASASLHVRNLSRRATNHDPVSYGNARGTPSKPLTVADRTL